MTWFHPECLFLTSHQYQTMANSNEMWFCDHCKSILANRVKWGDFVGEEAIYREIEKAHKEICSWKKNFFLLPRGNAATNFIKELTRLLHLFSDKTK